MPVTYLLHRHRICRALHQRSNLFTLKKEAYSKSNTRNSLLIPVHSRNESVRVTFIPPGITIKFKDRRKHRYGVIEASHGNDLQEFPITKMFRSFFKVIEG